MCARPREIDFPESQLTVMIAEELYAELKKHAIESRKTIKIWVAQAIIEKIAREQRAK